MSKVIIKSIGASFRRAGITATREGVEVDTSELTEAQALAINAEPRLVVYAQTEDGERKTQKLDPDEAKAAAASKSAKSKAASK